MPFDYAYLCYLTGNEGMAAAIIHSHNYGVWIYRSLLILASLGHIWWRSPDLYLTAIHGFTTAVQLVNVGQLQADFYHQSLMQYTFRRLLGAIGLGNGFERMLAGGILHALFQRSIVREWQPNAYGLLTLIVMAVVKTGWLRLVITYWLYLLAVIAKERLISYDYVLWLVVIPSFYVYARRRHRSALPPPPPPPPSHNNLPPSI